MMNKILATTILILLLAACSSSSKFEIKGTIEGADKQVVYLERAGLERTVVIDSAKLGKSGSFKFKHPATPFPEFYRLRLGDQTINIAVDSTESIALTAKKDNFESSYEVQNSYINEQMKLFNQQSAALKKQILALDTQLKEKAISPEQFSGQLAVAIAQYKEKANPMIFQDPASLASYFALFQRVFGYLIYDTSNKDDLKVFGAVATSFKFRYPEWPRTINLTSMTLKAIQASRPSPQLELDLEKIATTSILDIELSDYKGRKQNLLEIAKGNVTILSFTAYQAEFSPAINMALGEAYQKYSSKGLKIYQVSLDIDEHLFKVSASNLPWICVRDPQANYSQYLTLFNVQQLPALFVLNKNSEVVNRIEKIDALDGVLAKLL